MEHQALIKNMYTADPSAHAFNDKLYIFPSHDPDADAVTNDNGDQYTMVDYHVFEMDSMDQAPRDLGRIFHVGDVPWASKQLWAPDAALVNGMIYFYYPARDKDGIFRIGVATAPSPAGPYSVRPAPIKSSFSIDPCCFVDDDGAAYLSFGGLWGGQLEKWQTGSFNPDATGPEGNQPALSPKVARMDSSMLEFAEAPRDIVILDEKGKPLTAGDEDRRYFEGPWMHKYNGVYYFSYSTGTTHRIVYATADNPYGPYTYQGLILPPVLGWTTHHSIVEFRGQWYLFYHDASLSGGIDHKRSVKYARLCYRPDGSIVTVQP